MRKRIIVLTICFCFLFVTVVGRLGYLTLTDAYTVSDDYNSYSLVIDRKEPNIYYSNGDNINNNINRYVAIIRPNPKDIAELNKLFSHIEQQKILDELKLGYPVLREIDNKVKTKYIKIVKKTDSDYSTKQLLSKQSSGLLKYTNETIGKRKINFNVDALGRMLMGDSGRIIDEDYDSKSGYVLTIDKDIQGICDFAGEVIDSGAIIVMDVSTSNILACVTKPDDCYLNKCFEQYSVGSVFKIFVAACALENNVDPLFECNGSIKVGDTVFTCQKDKHHGSQHLKDALANSCNCYFVNLIQTLGKDKIIETSSKLGFYNNTNFYKDWNIQNSKMPSNNDLTSFGELSLLGFGQGKLMSTPLQICSALCTVANDGYYSSPNLISYIVDASGGKKAYGSNDERKAISPKSSSIILDYLRNVVTNGTGYNAEDSTNKSAGKTATAETGQYINGNQVYNTWFAGVYPYDNPKYAIVVMCENGTSGSEDCCPIFRTIVESINKM